MSQLAEEITRYFMHGDTTKPTDEIVAWVDSRYLQGFQPVEHDDCCRIIKELVRVFQGYEPTDDPKAEESVALYEARELLANLKNQEGTADDGKEDFWTFSGCGIFLLCLAVLILACTKACLMTR